MGKARKKGREKEKRREKEKKKKELGRQRAKSHHEIVGQMKE
jgi:hypothetical protein